MFVCPECGKSSAERGACDRCGVPLANGMDDPLLGKLVGSYLIARRIGAGGMGQVYLGVQPEIGSRVAIKVLSPECAQKRDLVERFFAEARAVNLIRHESIVNVLDLSQLPDGRPFIVMEYLDGESLSQTIRRRGPLPMGSLLRLLLEVLDALGAAHEKGIVHRDLKPDNVFVTPSGRGKVLDFGIAKLRPEQGGIGDATRTGSLLGTPHYMSPEQALGRHVDLRADLYAVGVILYEGTTGRRPFDAPTLYELLKLQVEHYPAPPSSFRPDLPPAIEYVIRRAIDKDPGQRFQSAAELSQRLAELCATLPPDAFAPLGSGRQLPASGPHAASSLPFAGGARMSMSGGASGVSPGSPLVTAGGTTHSVARSGGLSAAHLVIGGALLLGVATLAVSGIFAVLALRSSVSELPDPSATDTESPVADPTQEPNDESEDEDINPLMMPIPGYDIIKNDSPRRFDLGAFLTRAEQLAKKRHSDAVLERFDAGGVTRDGFVDLSTSGSYVLYRFRSPSQAKRPADLPTNVNHTGKCTVYVSVDKSRIMAFEPDNTPCDSPAPGKPRCSPTQVWVKAEGQGAPKGHLAGTLGFWANDGEKPRWFLTIPPSFSTFFADDC
jgi:serine/threonine protein kinase